MKKKILLTFIILTSFLVFSQDYQNALWPVKNADTGEGIIVKPQDYIGDELNFGDLFITANQGEIVVSPRSGVIKNMMYITRKDLITMCSYNHIYNDSLSIKEFDIEFRKATAKHDKLNPNDISILIGIKVDEGEMYYISGLRPIEFFKTGTKIKAGQEIGRVGYSYHKIDQPSILFSRSVKSKVADPMNIFGIKSTYIPFKKDKINYLKYKHSIEKLKKDFIVFRESLEEGHSGLYDYISRNELDKLFNQTYENITKPLTSEEFRIDLLPILRAIRDSHTALYSNKYKITDKSKLPILFGIHSDSLIVYSTLHGYKDFLHKKIAIINNEDISSIVSKVKRTLYGNDGFVESHDKRVLMLNFWSYYKKSKQFKKGDNVEIQFVDGSSKSFTYDFYDNGGYLPQLKHLDKKRFTIKTLPSNIGLVDLNTFQLLETDLDSIGSYISNPLLKHLIIDVRDNSGGDIEAIKQIYSFLAKEPFRISSSEMVNKRGKFNLFNNSLNYLSDSKLFENYVKVDNKKGFYLSDENFPFIEPNKEYHFDKDLYVLTNEFSKSASTVFPALVYKHKRGIIIGRETGSSYYQLNATKFVQIYLKNTGLELYMPLVKSIFDTKGNSDIPWGRGVLPDKVIRMSFKEFIDSNDTFIDATIEIIKDDKQKISKENNRTFFIIGSSLMLVLLVFVILGVKKKKTQLYN